MKTKENTLIVFAMREEAQGLFEAEGFQVLYTGLGKVNAAYGLTRELFRRGQLGQTTNAVYNFGTAGSSVHPRHSLVECTKFVQRDMDVTALGFAPGVTPYEDGAAFISMPRKLPHLREGVCGTGDNFEVVKSKHNFEVPYDVVDMEAFAYAKICQAENIEFVSVKYISDGSDDTAHEDWASNLPLAAKSFIDLCKEMIRSAV